MAKLKKQKEAPLEEKALAPAPKELPKTDLQNPPFDPNLPEQKQRWLR